ncbi:hypothetical protein HDV05_004962 [Chytridiales sp. JEL 0842]|nr:hypothetical protein HDV05_004962 [Chytridiales sp. JEL 0842]
MKRTFTRASGAVIQQEGLVLGCKQTGDAPCRVDELVGVVLQEVREDVGTNAIGGASGSSSWEDAQLVVAVDLEIAVGRLVDRIGLKLLVLVVLMLLTSSTSIIFD